MSTNNMSDEELDKLFRKSAESYDPPFDPEAWMAMEAKLDRLDTDRPWWYKYLYPLLILLLITTSVAVVKINRYTNVSPEVIKNELINVTAGGNEKLTFRVEQNQPDAVDNKTVSITEVNTESNKAGKPEMATAATDGAEIQNKPTPAKWSTDAIASSLEIKNNEEKTDQAVPAIMIQPVYDSLLITENVNQLIKADSSSKESQDADRQVFLGSLQFMTVVAPDITTVKFGKRDAISANAGLLIGIPVTNRFSVITGVIWANKVYGARPDNYAPSPDFWSGKKLPTTIDAACQVLDIPLNFRYQLYDGEKDVLAIQAGLSTYIMLNEKYTYNYTYGYKPYSKTVELSNRNRHWFGVQNLSVNYSRKLSPVVSVGVEPFVKIPYKGIGAGHVKLTSAGVFITAGYTIQLKR